MLAPIKKGKVVTYITNKWFAQPNPWNKTRVRMVEASNGLSSFIYNDTDSLQG